MIKIKQVFKRHSLAFIDGAVAAEKESNTIRSEWLVHKNRAVAEGD